MKERAPAGLGPKAASLFRDVVEKYELRRDELRHLEDACRTLDLIERLEVELAAGDLIVRGSHGQPVANPIASEIRQHRALLVRLMSACHLPDEEAADGGISQSRSTAGRALVANRWRRGA